jgi:hypothetical protein
MRPAFNTLNGVLVGIFERAFATQSYRWPVSQTLEEMVVRHFRRKLATCKLEWRRLKARLEGCGKLCSTRGRFALLSLAKRLREVGRMAVEFLAVREVVKLIAESGRAAVANFEGAEWR